MTWFKICRTCFNQHNNLPTLRADDHVKIVNEDYCQNGQHGKARQVACSECTGTGKISFAMEGADSEIKAWVPCWKCRGSGNIPPVKVGILD